MAEADDAGQITKAYGFNPNTHDAEEELWSTDPLWQADIHNGSLTSSQTRYHYITTDHLGTPILATDKSGNKTWRGYSQAFGHTGLEAGNSAQINLRFPGQYWDKETGLHQNYFRDYSPARGRYVQSDPIGIYSDVNIYAYSFNGPIIYFDPYGLFGMDDVWGGVYWVTGGWSPSQNTVNFAAGFGDALSFGIAGKIREFSNIGGVDICSIGYRYGNWSAIAYSLAWGGAHFGRHAMNVGAKKFFVDPRKYGTVQRQWSRSVGGYKGRYELHHWNRPRSAGEQNAGWNLVPVTPWLNNKMRDGGLIYELFRYSMYNAYSSATSGLVYNLTSNSSDCGC